MSAPPKKGLSLYANLLGSEQKQAGTTISSAPVKYEVGKEEGGGDGGATGQKKKDASLHFQPIRRSLNRPRQKKGPGHVFSSSTTTASLPPNASSPDKPTSSTVASSTPVQQPGVQPTNFEDWVGDDDDDDDADGYYFQDNRPKQERGGRKKGKKKKKGQQEAGRVWDWDDIYDPTLPNNYADYKGSEEQYREIRDWKARLYYHQLKEGRKKRVPSPEHDAPPAMNFAAPTFDNAPPAGPPPLEHDDDDAYYPPSASSRPVDTSDAYDPPPSFALIPASIPDDATGEDAYLRRLRMDGITPSAPAPLPPPSSAREVADAPPTDPRLAGRSKPMASPPAPAPAAVRSPEEQAKVAQEIAVKKANAAAKIAAFKAKMEAHKAAKVGHANLTPPAPTASSVASEPDPVESPPPPFEVPESRVEDAGTTISRAPVRYNLPPPDASLPTSIDQDVPMSGSEEPEVRSNRPGQKGFAERLLKKYGWEKGKGLGVHGNEGITTAIVAKSEKRKKRSDAEGGGYQQPANMGKIVGGKRRKVDDKAAGTESAEGGESAGTDWPYGPLSEVIKLEGMLEGLDVEDEIQNKDLFGEIGKEMEEHYGKTERVFVWRKEAGGADEVFVKFTSPLSALRAVGACHGMEFAGNTVKASFFNSERFEAKEYW